MTNDNGVRCYVETLGQTTFNRILLPIPKRNFVQCILVTVGRPDIADVSRSMSPADAAKMRKELDGKLPRSAVVEEFYSELV